MEYNEQYGFMQSLLQPDEILLWQGAPGPGKMKTYGKIPVFFGVIWLVFSLVMETACILSGQILAILFGLLFVLPGFLMTFGEPIRNAKLKGRIFYVVTDRRLLIQEGEEIKIFTADMLTPMQIRMNKNGTGTIYFERTYFSRKNNSPYNWICALQNLPDVGQAQSALTTMLSKSTPND